MLDMINLVHIMSRGNKFCRYRQNLKNFYFSYLTKSEYFANVYDTGLHTTKIKIIVSTPYAY